MTAKRKVVVIDTNTLISGIIFRSSTPRLAVTFAFKNADVLSSRETRNELRDVVGREKFDRYISLKERSQAIEDIIEDMMSVVVRESIQICRDPKDDKILELAVSGQADLIITGDKDLLVLHPFHGIAIITPLAYLAL